MLVLAELAHLGAGDGDFGGAPQQRGEIAARGAGKAFVDHFERRHLVPDDVFLTGQIIGTDVQRATAGIDIDFSLVDAVQQRIDFVL